MTLAWSQLVPRWRKMLLAYKKDTSMPNPFVEPDNCKLTCVCAHDFKLSDSNRQFNGRIGAAAREGGLRTAEDWHNLPSRHVTRCVPPTGVGC